MNKNIVVKKKKKYHSVPIGIFYIISTFNNTKITVTDDKGNTLVWNSSGRSSFKNTRKSLAFAAQVATKNASIEAKKYNMNIVDIKLNGFGPGREYAAKVVNDFFDVRYIYDVTGFPHNGVRAEKARSL